MKAENPILWRPPAPSTTRMHALHERVEAVIGGRLEGYPELHRWSVESPESFWRLWLDESGLAVGGDRSVFRTGADFASTRHFPKARVSFAGQLLRHRGSQEALVSVSESRSTVRLSRDQLFDAVGRFQAFLRASGVGPGDRVAGWVANTAESVIAMLATTGLGAIWSSASPDFGERAVLDRFQQIEPKVLIAANGYTYGGRRFDITEKLRRVREALPTLSATVVIPLVPGLAPVEDAVSWADALDRAASPTLLETDFNHPVYILYSSGTTGQPKCIVHGAGGTLLQHTKELILHSDLRPDDTIFYFTTCGWMMWNWLVSSLFVGARIVLFDGAPSFPDLGRLWRLAREEEVTHFGTSPKFLGSCRGRVSPGDLDALRVVLSTGSPLLPDDFDWIYDELKDVQLASISGGTDIIGCFMLGNPTLPVRRGEIQCLGLGMDVVALDGSGNSVVGEKGELVCRSPFPSMPLGFWNDPEQRRFRSAYFETFHAGWAHGDYIEITGSVGSAGGVVVYGRSDATLNPGGVRIGTAEIYRQVESLDGVRDALVVGQPFEGDERVVLFVQLEEGVRLDGSLVEKIESTIRTGASPRHVPAKILEVGRVPYTISGKKVELAVREILCGREPKNVEALVDPAALDDYRSRPELD